MENTEKKNYYTWHGFLFKEVDLFCSNFKYFFYYHENAFEIIFLMIYLIEQLALLYLFYFGTYNVQLVVGIFTLLFLFTISFEKVLLKMRNKKLAEEKVELERGFYEQIVRIYEQTIRIKEESRPFLEQYGMTPNKQLKKKRA